MRRARHHQLRRLNKTAISCHRSGTYHVKLAPGDVGELGITFKEVSIGSVDSGGVAQYRCAQVLRAGMVLRGVNGVEADQLPFQYLSTLLHGGHSTRGLVLRLQAPEQAAAAQRSQQYHLRNINTLIKTLD